VTVDNTRNDSDVYVKLFGLNTKEPAAVRHFLIKSHEEFKIADIRPGRYDIRYRNHDSGLASKTEVFELKETRVENVIRYSDITLTLYKIAGGNMRIQEITDEEFGD
jgi:hypothetical protein